MPPDGGTLFVNVQVPGTTFAIWGPWLSARMTIPVKLWWQTRKHLTNMLNGSAIMIVGTRSDGPTGSFYQPTEATVIPHPLLTKVRPLLVRTL